MSKYLMLVAGAAAMMGIATLQASKAAQTTSPDDIAARAKKLHFSSIVIDTHDDTTQRLIWDTISTSAIATPTATSIFRACAKAASARFSSPSGCPAASPAPRRAKSSLDQIDAVREQVRPHPKDLVLCATAEEIRRAHAEGKIAVLMGVEGGHMINDDLAVLALTPRSACAT